MSLTSGDAPGSDLGQAQPPRLGHFVALEQESALEHFHRALARLSAGEDEDGKVRILAYGASHTQADIYPSYLRTYLQSRFGDGGQGFVLLGRLNSWYRPFETRVRHRDLTVHHARQRLRVEGEPLGLLGAALVGNKPGAYGEIVTSPRSRSTRFEVHYLAQPRGGAFSLSVDERRIAVVSTRADAPRSAHFAFETTPGKHTIRARLQGGGTVRLLGIIAETGEPGVVIDTLGIGGARMSDHLRWQDDTWIEAVRHRNPDLVTFAYGTNEAADATLQIAAYEQQVRSVLDRVRRALPDVSCVLIGPFDLTGEARQRLSRIVDAQRRISREVGCGFWDGHAFMGGQGSIQRWAAAKPPLASSDRIHLTRLGYVYTGIALGDALLRAYDLKRRSSSETLAVERIEPESSVRDD